MTRVVWVFASSALAAALGGAAAMGFTAACGRFHYVAETSGQVAIGTGVYGVARQIADLVSVWWNQRPVRRTLFRSLRDYVSAAEGRIMQPRDYRTLESRIRELRELRAAREREYFDRALQELENHGTAGEYALLSDDIQTIHIKALITRLA
jgi:hypothetical protein